MVDSKANTDQGPGDRGGRYFNYRPPLGSLPSVGSITSGPDGAWTLVSDSVCPRPSSSKRGSSTRRCSGPPAVDAPGNRKLVIEQRRPPPRAAVHGAERLPRPLLNTGRHELRSLLLGPCLLPVAVEEDAIRAGFVTRSRGRIPGRERRRSWGAAEADDPRTRGGRRAEHAPGVDGI